jgi:hypothetical protein
LGNWRDTPPVLGNAQHYCVESYNSLGATYLTPDQSTPGNIELERCGGADCDNFSIIQTSRYTIAIDLMEVNTSFIDEEIELSTVYRYRVRLHADYGEYGPYSNVVEITTCVDPTPPGANDGRLKILIMGDDFPDEFSFSDNVQTFVNQLAAVPLFTRNLSKIKFLAYYNRPGIDLGCHHPDGTYSSIVTCDFGIVLEQAANISYDKIIVLYNNNGYFGTSGFYVIVSTGTGNYLGLVAAHELGHSLGGLGDEYLVGGSTFEGAISKVNCDVNACPKWTGMPGTSCIQECGHRSAYRSMENTIIYHHHGVLIIQENFSCLIAR